MEQKHIIKIESEYLQCSATAGVVIPAQIEKFLILLHGYNGSFKHLDDNLPLTEYANAHNMMIVTPDMNNGYYLNRPNYRVNEFLMLELIPQIFASYGLNESLPMYMAGISMGGYGSMLIGSAFASRFQKIISVSGAFIAHDVAIGNPQVVGAPGDNGTVQYFMDIFAPFDTLEDDANRNPIAAVIARKEAQMPKIIITCGTKDELYERNVAAIKQFGEHGVAYDWCPIDGGVHDYKCFDEGLRYAFGVMEE